MHYWADLQPMPVFHCCGNVYIHIQYYRPGLQCKCVSIDVDMILHGQLSVKFTLTLFYNSQSCSTKTCIKCKMLSSACTRCVDCFDRLAMLDATQLKRMIAVLHFTRFTQTHRTRLSIALAVKTSTYGKLTMH